MFANSGFGSRRRHRKVDRRRCRHRRHRSRVTLVWRFGLLGRDGGVLWRINCCYFTNALSKGWGCSTVEEHTPRNLGVMGSKPAGGWAYFILLSLLSISCLCLFLLSFTSGVSLVRSPKEVHLKLCVVKEIEKMDAKLSCLWQNRLIKLRLGKKCVFYLINYSFIQSDQDLTTNGTILR